MTIEAVRTTIYIPKEMKERIEKEAKRDGRSFSNYLVQVLLKKALDEREQ